MISALDEMDSVVRCIEAGAEDYLPKPFDPTLLRARIHAGLTSDGSQLERTRVRDVFARFLPETVVDEVLRDTNGEPAPRWCPPRRHGAVQRPARVHDVRRATHRDVVVDVLNRYFGEMSDAMLDNGGTLLASSVTASSRCSARRSPPRTTPTAHSRPRARCSYERLPRFNDWVRRAELGDGFRMGIGVCSGPFMSGNVGSARRLEYTAIGDTVNTAARLQEMTKELGRAVLVSDSTRALLHGGSECTRVRGGSRGSRQDGARHVVDVQRPGVTGNHVGHLGGVESTCGDETYGSYSVALQRSGPSRPRAAAANRVGRCGEHDGGRSDDGQARAGARARHARRLPRDRLPAAVDGRPGAKRLADTKCAETQLTANQVEGFDADATKLVAKGLGVEACFATPSWTEITAGNWGDRCDIAYGSGSINADRMERLYMTQPYYAVPNYYFVAKSLPGEACTRSRRQADRLVRELLARDVPQRRP